MDVAQGSKFSRNFGLGSEECVIVNLDIHIENGAASASSMGEKWQEKIIVLRTSLCLNIVQCWCYYFCINT